MIALSPSRVALGRVMTLAATALLVASACSTAAEAEPSPPEVAQAPSPTPVVTPTPAPTPTPTPAPTPTPTPEPTVRPGTVEEPRAVLINMTDEIRYDPAVIEIQAGETIRFVVQNPTKLDHDFTIGDEMAQMHHEEEMARFYEDGGMMHGHDESNAVLLRPGETKMLVMTFDAAGELIIGCHIPGHYAAGMHGLITITG